MTHFRIFTMAAILATISQVAVAQNPYGIALKPGERLVSVNGVAVNGSTATRATPTASTHTAYRPVTTTAAPQPAQTASVSMYGGSDQQRAQAEANYMAQHGITGHVGGTIGRFEGVGWSTSGTPPTCTPSYAMTLTADAIAYGRGGAYRVRAWR